MNEGQPMTHKDLKNLLIPRSYPKMGPVGNVEIGDSVEDWSANSTNKPATAEELAKQEQAEQIENMFVTGTVNSGENSRQQADEELNKFIDQAVEEATNLTLGKQKKTGTTN